MYYIASKSALHTLTDYDLGFRTGTEAIHLHSEFDLFKGRHICVDWSTMNLLLITKKHSSYA